MKDPVEILVVEDNASDAELTLHMLSRHHMAGGPNGIKLVEDGAEALDFLFGTGQYTGRDGGDPKLILLDLKLPKVDGLEVLRRAKADPRTRNIPVIVLSASVEDRDLMEAHKLGVDSHLVKPADSGVFAATVRAALGKANATNHPGNFSDGRHRVPLGVLILEDRAADAELIMRELERSGYDLRWQRVETEPELLAHLNPLPDVILADYTMPELDTRRALQLLQERGLHIPFIVVSGMIPEDVALSLLQQGATDYLLKDRLGRLGAAVSHALAQKELRQQNILALEELQASEMRFHAFMRHSPALAFIENEFCHILYMNHVSEEAEFIAAQLGADCSVFATCEPSRKIEQVEMPDGRVRQMLCFRFLFHSGGGRRLLGGVAVDITEQKAAEHALSQALAAKDVLLKELHHRVKNNLQMISSLLRLQGEHLAEPGRQALRDAQRRVQSMALIHEQMYGHRDSAEVDFGEYARRLARDLLESFGADRVRLRFALDPVTLAMDQMIPCGLILNELITNALKYAFQGDHAGEILVSVRCEDGRTVSMTVADNGVGLPPESAQRPGALGSQLVEILTRQLEGEFERQSADGLRATVTFTRSTRL